MFHLCSTVLNMILAWSTWGCGFSVMNRFHCKYIFILVHTVFSFSRFSCLRRRHYNLFAKEFPSCFPHWNKHTRHCMKCDLILYLFNIYERLTLFLHCVSIFWCVYLFKADAFVEYLLQIRATRTRAIFPAQTVSGMLCGIKRHDNVITPSCWPRV